MNHTAAGQSDPDATQAPAAGLSLQNRPARWLALAIFIYGVGYLIWFLGTPLGRAPQLDAAENLALAGQIAHGALAHEPFYRAMLYPAVLALPLLLGWPAEWLPALAYVIGLVSHFAVTLAVARLAAQLWRGKNSHAAALLAAALWGLNPVALFYAIDVLDTTPALALFFWGIVLLARPNGRRRDALGSDLKLAGQGRDGSPSRPRTPRRGVPTRIYTWFLKPSVIGGALLALSVAARPNFMPVVIIAPLARAWLSGRWQIKKDDLLAWAGAAVPLLLLGGIQLVWAGQFRILPWQGAFNFYAANRVGANGRYFAQQEVFSELAPGENPARKESELMYEQQTKAVPPLDIKSMETYWNMQARTAIMNYPGRWLSLLGRKAYYLLNDFDQYNNKTYAWHQEQSPWLRWNFLGWGILFVLAAGMVPVVWGRGEIGFCSETGLTSGASGGRALPAGAPTTAPMVGRGVPDPLLLGINESNGANSPRPMLAGIALIFFAYAAGVLLYYASGRFRLPLMPWLCVLAGGWGVYILDSGTEEGAARLRHYISGTDPIHRRGAVLLRPLWTLKNNLKNTIPHRIAMVSSVLMLFAAALTFSNFFAAHDESTFIEDELLTANAAMVVGEDAQAYALAETALATDPTQPTAKEIAVVSYYNLSAAGEPGTDSLAGWNKQLARMEGMNLHNAPLTLVAGMALWKTGNQANAMEFWQNGATRFGADSSPAQALAAAKSLQGTAPPNSPPPDPAMVKYLQQPPAPGRE